MKNLNFPLIFTLLSFSLSTHALDGKKSGFWGELGIGLGQLEYSNVSFDETESGIVTNLRIGYGFTNRFQLFYLRNATWTAENDYIIADGISGLGANIWLNSSIYLMAGTGIGDLTPIYTGDDEYEDNADQETGNAYLGGIGYEFAKHNNLQVSLLKTDIDDIGYSTSAFQVVYSFSFY